MSRIIQFKRYGAAAIANTVGANGEIIFDLTNRVITVHDGVTPGGFAVQTDNTARNLANSAFTISRVLASVDLVRELLTDFNI